MSKPKLRLLLIDHVHIPEDYPFVLDEGDPSFQALKEDIHQNGLREPVHVRKRPAGEYTCLDGVRRLKATLALKATDKTAHIPCYVYNRRVKLKGVHNGKRER